MLSRSELQFDMLDPLQLDLMLLKSVLNMYVKVSNKILLCLDVETRWNSTYLMLDATEKFEAVKPRKIQIFG